MKTSAIGTRETAKMRRQSGDLLDPKTRRRYEKARAFFGKKLRPLAKEVRDSERLTKEDFAIRINAR